MGGKKKRNGASNSFDLGAFLAARSFFFLFVCFLSN